MKLSRIILTAWFLLAATAAAGAGPVGAAISAVASMAASAGIAGTLLKAAFGIAVNIGISLLQRAMAKKQEQPVAGVSVSMKLGGDNPLSFIVGRYATNGQLEYAGTWGRSDGVDNAWLVQVISLADIPVSALVGISVDGEDCTLETGEADKGFHVDGYGGKLYVKFYDGTQTEADQYLIDSFSGTEDADRPYLDDMIFLGVPYAIVSAQIDDKLFSGAPKVRFVLDGIKLYDVRKDTTAGGSGSHRWNDQATWEWSDNPFVVGYNILRGISWGGQWIYGGQTIPASRLPASSWMAAMNEADRAINLSGGGTEKQFRIGAEITGDTQPLDVLDEIMKSSNGRMTEIGGIYKVLCGVPGGSVYTFTDEDIVITEGQSFDPFPGLEDTQNGMHASYPEPAEAWNMKDAPPYYVEDYEEADGGRRLAANVSFPMVPFAIQIQRLMRTMVEENRRFRRHQMMMPPETWLLEPNDVVTWNSARNGYVTKKFLITSMDDGDDVLQGMALQELEPGDYDWSSTFQLPYSVQIITPLRPAPQPMTGWSVAATSVPDSDGTGRRPAIQVNWDETQLDTAGVRIQIRLEETEELVFEGETRNFAAGTAMISGAAVLPNEDYEVRGIYIPISPRRDAAWSGWLPVTTLDIRLGDLDVYDGVLGFEKLKADVQEWQKWVGQGTRELIDSLLEAATLASTQDLANFDDKQTLRREIVSTRGDITAAYTEAITVATGPNSALGQRIERIEVVIPTLATLTITDAITARVTVNENGLVSQASAITAIQNDLTGKASVSAVSALDTRVTETEGDIATQGTAITATADAVIALEAVVGGISASANFRASVYAGPSGYSSRIGLEARVGGTGTYRSASLFIDVPASTSSPTRVAVVADQFIITDGTNNSSPFVFSGGVARMNVANIGTITAGILQSADSKMVINLNNKTFVIGD